MTRTLSGLGLAVATLAAASQALAGPVLIKAQLTASPKTAGGACPVKITFAGEVVVTQITPLPPERVAVQIVRSDGAQGPVTVFAPIGAGYRHPVNGTWLLGGPGHTSYSGWEEIKAWPVSAGSRTTFSNKATFTMKCRLQRTR